MPTPNEPKTLTSEEIIRLEALVDAYGLAGVVEALATVAWMKADHVRAVWFNESLAVGWSEASRRLREVSRSAVIRNTSPK